MKKLFLAILMLGIYTPSHAAEQSLKVRSYQCSFGPDHSHTLYGSGTIINKTQILTSSHVVLHGTKKDGVCHEVRGEKYSWVSVELLHVNASRGLAILSAPVDASEAPLVQFAPQTPDDVTVNGFPARSLELVPKVGHVIARNSKSIFLPTVGPVLEVVDAHSEFGMSGGGVFDSLNPNVFVGLLSHQYLSIEKGKPAVIRTQHSDDQQAKVDDLENQRATMIALVIPSSTILAWFDEISRRNPLSEFREDLDTQLRGTLSVTFGSLRFSEDNCNIANSDEGDGIGGREGGGQGGGIGGKERGGQGGDIGGVASSQNIESLPESGVCQIVVKRVLGDQIKTNIWPLPNSQKFFDHLLSQISNDEASTFSLLVGPNLREKVQVEGLYHALTLIGRGFTPIMNKPNSKLPLNISALLNEGQTALDALVLLAKRADAPESAVRLVDFFGVTFEAIRSGNYYLVNPSTLRQALETSASGPYQEGWNYFFSENFEASVQMHKVIVRVAELLSRNGN